MGTLKKASASKMAQKDFGERLQCWLARKKMSRKEFGAAAGLLGKDGDQSQLSKILSGQRNLELKTMTRLAAAIGLTLDEFYADKEFSAMEKRFKEDIGAFRQFLMIADEEALRDVRRAIRHATSEVNDRASPGRQRQVG